MRGLGPGLLIVLLISALAFALARVPSLGALGISALTIAILIGALLGTWIARALGLPEIISLRLGEEKFPVVWSVVGAAIFVAVLSLVSGRRRTID